MKEEKREKNNGSKEKEVLDYVQEDFMRYANEIPVLTSPPPSLHSER